jgi:NHL repeat-containing protein
MTQGQVDEKVEGAAMRGQRWASGRRSAGRILLALVAAAALVLTAALGVAAGAETLRLLGSFGSPGAGGAQFRSPRGVAVDTSHGPSRGDVYVADLFNQRVEKFGSVGNFLLAFGKAVNATKVKQAGEGKSVSEAEENVCTASSGDVCQAAESGPANSEFKLPLGVAVDPGSGDVYVEDFSNHRVEKYTPSGEFLLMLGGGVNKTTGGNVCTAAEVCQAGVTASSSEAGEGKFHPWGVGAFLAVGSSGTVYVGDENRVQEFNSAGVYKSQIELPGTGRVTALALDSSEDLYVVSQALSGVRKYNSAGAQLAVLDPGAAGSTLTALALQPGTGDVFVALHQEGEVRIQRYTPAGALSAESEGGLLAASTGLSVNASGTVYAADSNDEAGADKVLLLGEPPTEGNPPPSIDTESVTSLGATEATLGAQIDPHFLKTVYYVEYGPSTEYSLGRVPASPATIALGGGVVQADEPAAVALDGLTPGTTYHFRFVAESETAKGETLTSRGPDRSFTTFAAGASAGLPDGRVYEQASPLHSNGNETGVGVNGSVVFREYGVASPDGERVLFFQQGSLGETRSGYDIYSVSTRDAQTGWHASAALPPGCGVNASNFFGEEPQSLLPSADLSSVAFAAAGGFGAGNCLQPTKEDPLAYDMGLYRTAVRASEPEHWLTKPTISAEEQAHGAPGPTPNPVINEVPIAVGGSPDLQSVYFTFFGTLVPEDRTRAKNVEASPANSAYGFYEWTSGGGLRSAGVLPDEPGEPAKGEPDEYGAVPAATGRELHKPRPRPTELNNEVSSDGSKAFFISPDPVFAHEFQNRTGKTLPSPTELYVRERSSDGTARTVLVSRDERELEEGKPKPAPGAGFEEAVVPVNTYTSPYVFASPDGSRAFFASADRLTEAAPQGSRVKEYEFNLDTNRLTYMEKFAEPPSRPFSTILASSQDGSSFIFENTAERKLQLWERSPGGQEQVTDLAAFSAPTSPSFEARAVRGGAGTAFVVRTDAVLNPGSFDNGAATQQVYRYVHGGKLTCVSCAPDGTAQSEAQGFGWARVIADQGARVFFVTAEQLLARATNGVDNVYEWEQAGTGSCHSEERAGGCVYLISTGSDPNPSELIDSSESGNDVFLASSQPLVHGDSGETYAVYDARVNGGFPEQAPPAECLGSCRTPTAPPALAAPLSTVLGPSGNLTAPLAASPPSAKPKPKPLTRAQKLARALKACAKKPKRKRAACVRQAQSHYGANSVKRGRPAGRHA